jgi:Uncharacterized homolog of gamma-carboxymuconolactone decarboxylase subunit
MSNPVSLADRLANVRSKRGYLLPHHGLLAVTSPRILDAYDELYTALALDERVLNAHDREFVWLAILIATDEAIATHHIAKFRAAGGTDAEIEAVLALTGQALGVESYRFVATHWQSFLPTTDPRAAYLRTIEACAGVNPRLVHMAAAAVHTCKARWDALSWHIVAAYECGIDEAELAEAISLAMFPGSVPHFVEAARVWRELIIEGKVSASPMFREWAALSGQGGHREASDPSSPAA